MRGIPSLITEIRKKVFTEVARMAYSGDYTDMEDIPFKIVPGQSPLHRESVFLERAIAGERVRLAMGLSLQPVQTRTLLTEGMDQAAIAEQYYEPPLVNIIPYACHACPTKQYRVTELCQGCLASSCQRVCPKGAVKFVNGKSRIDQKLCIKCGKCARSCPYNAITYLERPCQAACGMDAIGVDEYGKACIDYDRCVSCGQCLVSCPFGAIVDKSQIYQVIRSMLEGNEVVAIVAPSFVGQFGRDVTVPKFLTAMKQLGFADVVEVAAGADICTIEEAHDFLEKVPNEQRFMATSCCPSWRMMARRLFPAESGNISMTPQDAQFLKELAKEGVASRGLIGDLKNKVETLKRDVSVWKRKYEKLQEQTKDFMAALKRAPRKVKEFIQFMLHTEPEKPEQSGNRDMPRRKKRDMEL